MRRLRADKPALKATAATVLTSAESFCDERERIDIRLKIPILQFKVTTLDVGVPEEAQQIVSLAESFAPVGGIFHLAMYLADKLIANQASHAHSSPAFLQTSPPSFVEDAGWSWKDSGDMSAGVTVVCDADW